MCATPRWPFLRQRASFRRRRGDRHADADAVQPLVEVRAELPPLYHRLQIAEGGEDEPAQHLPRPDLPEGLDVIQVEGTEAGVVVEVMQKGYRFEGLLIRPAIGGCRMA